MSTALWEARSQKNSHQVGKSKNYTPFVVVFKVHKIPLCKLSLHIKSFFDASAALHDTLRWPVFLWLLLSLLFLILIMQFVILIEHRGHRRTSLLLKAKQPHLEVWRKYQKRAVPCAVLPHWSSFNWILGLTTLAHSLTGDDRGPSVAGKLDWSHQEGCWLISGRHSKTELDLEATLLPLYDKVGKWICL